MNKNILLLLFFLIFFLISLSSVSAIENDEFILTEDPQIVVSDEDSIQSAIDNATPGSTIIIEKGNYSEDLVISKELSIIGQNANLYSINTAFTILPTANNTSISGFNIVVSDSNGTGIFINSSNCKITDNNIRGGNIGIFSDLYISNSSSEINISCINNVEILRNNISNVGEAGILINAFNPTVCRNRVSEVTNSKENGTAIGIKVNGIGVVPQDLNVNVMDNYVSNVKSLNESAYGMDIAGNSVFDTLVEFNVENNVVENVMAQIESYGMKIGAFSLNTTLPTIKVNALNISQIYSSDYENSSVTGLSFSVTTIGQNDTSDAIVQNVNINDLNALGSNSAATGIDATGVGCVDIYISGNNVTDIKSFNLATGIAGTGIEYINFKALVSVSNNNITDLYSSKIKGINVMSLGNAEINKNFLYNLPSEDSTFITGVTLSIKLDNINLTVPQNASFEEIQEFLNELASYLNETNITIDGNLTVYGNNIEGSGVETGFAVVRPSIIHYNRATNMKINVIKDSTRKFLLESYGYDPNISSEELAYLLLKSQPSFENCTEEELRNMSVSLGAFLDKFFGEFDNLTAGDVDARFNWWGTNSRPSASGFINNNGSVIYDPWLTLQVNSSPSVINYGEYSKITADVYIDSSGFDHSSDADLFFSGPRVTLSTDKGSFDGEKSITLDWINGKAIAYLYGDDYGLATVHAFDYDDADTTVLILGKNSDENNSAVLPSAGNPLFLIFYMFVVLGLGIFKRR